MKVAIVQEHVDASRGGAETSTLELARELARLGPRVTLIAASRGPGPATLESDSADQSAAGVAVHWIDVGAAGKLARTRRFVAGAAALCDGTFDVVHAISPCPGCDVYQPRGGLYPEAIERSLAPTPPGWRRALHRLGKRLNARQRYLTRVERQTLTSDPPPRLAALSKYVAEQVRRRCLGFPADRIHVIFNGVNMTPRTELDRAAQRRALGLADGARCVLFVAHNFKLKGLRELIRAAAVAPRPSWQILIAGRDRPEPYERLARRLGVAGWLRFLDASSDLRPLYAAADVLAHPTWYDPCSRVVLEAIRCGLPVVTTRWNGAADAVTPERGVVLDEPDDVAGLAAAIDSLARRGRAAAPRSGTSDCPELSMARHAIELLKLYEELSAQRRR